jgi:small subunit ribosomal protein S9
MPVGVSSLRCSARAVLDEVVQLARPQLRTLPIRQARPLTTSTTPRAAVVDIPTQPDAALPPKWSMTKESTRLVPVSASYFTGNADFFDNWLALQDLLRKYQTLPTIPKDNAPSVKWRTLAAYRGMVGRDVKAAKYKKIIDILDRLNCIDPQVIPEEVTNAINMYKRDTMSAVSQKKAQEVDEYGRAHGLGRRKTSVARVVVLEGDGQVVVNGKPLASIFERIHDRESALWPLVATQRMQHYNVWANVEGGGKTGQAEALTLGIARALMVHEPALKPALRRGVFYYFSHICWTYANFAQLDVSPVMPEWLSVRSPESSRPARCLPGSSVKGRKSLGLVVYYYIPVNVLYFLDLMCSDTQKKKVVDFTLHMTQDLCAKKDILQNLCTRRSNCTTEHRLYNTISKMKFLMHLLHNLRYS